MADESPNLPARPEALDEEKRDRERRTALLSAREEQGWTQAVVAKHARISQSKLSLYERGIIGLTQRELKAVEDFLFGKTRTKPKRRGKGIPLAVSMNGTINKKWERKKRLREAGVTQALLAKKIGVYRTKITEWASGKLDLPADEQAKIDRILAEATVIQQGKDPYYLAEIHLNMWVREHKRVKQLEQLIQADKALLRSNEELIRIYKEIIREYKDWTADETSKVADLEKRNAELRDLLDLKTKEALLRDKIESEEPVKKETVPRDGDD